MILDDNTIAELIEKAIDAGVTGYDARLDIRLLQDAMEQMGMDTTNEFHNKDGRKLPIGTYKFIAEVDLGEVGDKCEFCGHPIRYQEILYHKESGNEFIVGNECIYKFLGKHDLIKVAISLGKKITAKIENRKKAKEAKDTLGDLIAQIRKIDPDRKLTAKEQKYFDLIDSKIPCKSVNTIIADDIKKKFTPEEMLHTRLALEFMTNKYDRNILMNFLKYKRWGTKGETDFWQNCIDQLEREEEISTGRLNAIFNDYLLYYRITNGDPALIDEVKIYKNEMTWLLEHNVECNSWIFISLAEKLLKFGELTSGQINVMRSGCRNCHKTL